MQTIPEKFIEIVKKFPDKKALLFKEGGKYRHLTFSRFLESVKIASVALREMGIKKGDKVAIMSEGRPEWAIVDLAVMSIGAITIPIHTNLSAKIINYIIGHSEAKIIFASKTEYLNKISQDEAICLENFVLMGDVGELDKKFKKVFSLDEFMSRGKAEGFKLEKMNSNDICSIIYTSGTTGLPKGVMLSHKNFLSDVEMVHAAVPVYSSDVFLSFLPLSHVLERTGGYYTPLLSGATIAYAESVKTLMQNLKETRPTILICVPRIFEKFSDGIWDNVAKSSSIKKKIFYWALKTKKSGLGHFFADGLAFKKIRKKMGGRLRLAISGGAALDERIGKFFNKVGITILEGYGLTETSPVLSVNRENNFKWGTVGLPLKGLEVKISHDKEILAKGPTIMKGYFKNEAETAEVIDADGWFHTGDYGFIDSDGFLAVVGRKKEMIVMSGGKNVWPEHIETELNFDKLVSQSLIIGHKRKFVSALIVPNREELEIYLKLNGFANQEIGDLKHNKEILEVYSQCVEKVNSSLSDYEQIRKFCLVDREFSQELDEVTPTLKIRRHAIEHHFKDEIEKMY